MGRGTIKRTRVPRKTAGNPAVTGADFLLSMVEAHHTRRNGNVIKMNSAVKAQEELLKIEQQIERLRALKGQNEQTRREIEQLHERVDSLRREVSDQGDLLVRQ